MPAKGQHRSVSRRHQARHLPSIVRPMRWLRTKHNADGLQSSAGVSHGVGMGTMLLSLLHV